MHRDDPFPEFPIGPVVESVGGQLPYSIRSGWQKIRCPMHDDRNPSATVNFQANRIYCFSCGLNEDSVGLLDLVHGYGTKAAIEEAERITGQSRKGVRAAPRRARTLFGE